MDKLFLPGQIGSLTLDNRLIMTPMHLGYCPDGKVTPKLVEFYRTRAKGGVGLIVVGGCGIDKLGNAMGMIQLDEDQFIPGLQQLVDAVHDAGAKIIPQLYQAGRYASTRTGQKPIAPSPIPSKLTGETPKELSLEEIAEVICSYQAAALRAQRAGFDGVEILASAGYLIAQFLSPLTNHREDRYGGDLQGRMTFGLEILKAVRSAVGPDFPIVVRVAGNDFMPGGNTNTEARIFCRALQDNGADAINVTGGWHETHVPQLTMNVPPGAFRYLAKGIKQVVSIPVIACNRITTPEVAEEILVNGDADFIGLARPLLADPDFPRKAKARKSSEIRPCIGCNQGCLDHTFRLKPVNCLVNPEAGKEAASGPDHKVKAQKILVIGAGPGGLAFSLEAASLGHQVTIWEQSKEPGGQLTLAAVPPGRQDFLRLVSFLHNSCTRAGVQLHFEVTATEENIAAAVEQKLFDAVVLATGAQPLQPVLAKTADMPLVQAWEILAGAEVPAGKTLIIGGGAVGVETALYMANFQGINPESLNFLWREGAEQESELRRLGKLRGKDITIIEMAKGIGRDIGASTRWSMLQDLKRSGINTLDQTKALELQAGGVLVEKAGEQELIPADQIVLAVGAKPCNHLFQRLSGRIPQLFSIGDANSPRKAMDAIHEGYELAKQISGM